MRILVTGPRNWESFELLESALTDCVMFCRWELGLSGRPTLVYGKAPGLDNMSAEVAVNRGWLLEGYAANWHPKGDNVYDVTAGFTRNQIMVDTRPDVCAVFCMECRKLSCATKNAHFTHGTMDCYRRVQEAGIPARKYYA